MKKLLTLAVLVCTALALVAGDVIKGRVDTRVLMGFQGNVQDEINSLMVPVTALNSLYMNVTNKSDGILMLRTNATVIVHVVLPNPTNYPGRRFEITTCGACTGLLSNAVVGTFTDMYTLATASTFAFASNKTATVFSTGTNWIARAN